MKKNKIFITGARGFVGKKLVNYCRQHNFIVFNPSRKELDLNNYKKTSLYLNLHNPDFIIHLASRTTPRINSSVEYKKQFKDTINPTINIAMAASKKLRYIQLFTTELRSMGLRSCAPKGHGAALQRVKEGELRS